MACDPATLIASARCLSQGMGTRQLLAAWTNLECNTTPPTGDTRITEEGETRITEEGDTRIVEP